MLCSNGCGLDIAVAGGRMVGVRGRAEDRVNHGRLGPKGLFHSELFKGTRSGGLGLLRDLQGARDSELVEVVKACQPRTATQLKWLKTRMKQAAPQALVVAS